MASIKPHKGKWRAEVCFKGIRKSKVLSTKSMASSWARQIEFEIESLSIGKLPNKTFGELLDEYELKVSSKKRTELYERNKIKTFKSCEIAKVKLEDLNESHFSKWRDDRLKTVSNATVRREWNILSNACNVAVKEWKWLKFNPLSMIKKPPPPKHRDRLITDNEIELIKHCAGYSVDMPLVTSISRVGAIFLFAIELGMRLKEMTRLTWDNVHSDYVRVTDDSKTGRRDVPLSKEAVRIIKQLEQVKDGERVFQLTESQVDALFRKVKTRAVVSGFTFHDTKHLACTRLAKKLIPFDLARMVGTRDLKTLMIYYNESASDIAKKLD